MERPTVRSSKLLVIVSVAFLLLFLFSVSRTLAATTYHIKAGGEITGVPFAKGGVVWFNGYDPGTIVIHPGDTVVWDLVGGVHTVTSTGVAANGSFVFDSSPLFTPEAALADMGPGKLLPPGSVFELDTGSLPPGTYAYICKIHPGMRGNLTVTSGPVTSPIVTVIAGWGDHVYAVQAFAPNDLTVPQGTIVRWTLLNPMEPHTITGFNSTGAVAWDSSPDFPPPGPPPGPPPFMVPGQSFSVTFNNPGTFTYFCKLHAVKVGQSWVGMSGTVLVVPLTAAFDPTSVNSSVNGLSAVAYGSLVLSIVALLAAIFATMRARRAPKTPP